MNRKQRRAQATSSSQIDAASDIPLGRPSETPDRQAKTLYELAAERQAALSKDGSAKPLLLNDKTVVNVAIGPNGEIRTLDGGALPGQTEDDLPPWIDTLLLSLSLASLHFTLNALTYYQYAETLPWKRVFWETVLQAFPVLFLLIHFMHGHLAPVKVSRDNSQKVDMAKQLLYVAVANMAGCHLIRLVNEEGYMAVMKNAPSIGTLWVWTVIEMGLAGALLGVVGPALYAWYYGYGVF